MTQARHLGLLAAGLLLLLALPARAETCRAATAADLDAAETAWWSGFESQPPPGSLRPLTAWHLFLDGPFWRLDRVLHLPGHTVYCSVVRGQKHSVDDTFQPLEESRPPYPAEAADCAPRYWPSFFSATPVWRGSRASKDTAYTPDLSEDWYLYAEDYRWRIFVNPKRLSSELSCLVAQGEANKGGDPNRDGSFAPDR